LQTDQNILTAEVKRCCHNASVTLADVERHVTTLLGDVFGLVGGGGSMTGGKAEGSQAGSGSVQDMAAWLRSYFVAKEELETRLTSLTAAMHINTATG